MSHDTLSVAVFGATGLLGEATLSALGDADVALAVHALGGVARSPKVDSAQLGTRTIPVYPASRFPDLSFSVAVLCLPSKAAALIGPALVARGVFVVDAGDAGGLAAPVWLPDAPLPDDALRAGAVRLPSGAGALLARIAAPLAGAGLRGVSGTALLPAGRRGRAAVEELGQQVLASFTSQDPPRAIFADGLAFDVLPETADDDTGWSSDEIRAHAQASALSGLPADAFAVTQLTVPTFAGAVASLHLHGVGVDTAKQALTGAAGLGAPGRPAALRPRACDEDALIRWGRLRDDGAGGCHVQLVADPLPLAGELVRQTMRRLAEAGIGRSRA